MDSFRRNIRAIPSIRACLVLLVLLLVAPLAAVRAQDGGGAPPVVVTTQDYASLRAGPSEHFARLAVIDPAVDLPAIGRSVDTRWVQVVYNGQTGWIYAGLLVWIGDIIQLPVDGVNPNPYVRRMLVTGVTTRDTPLYAREITPEDQVGELPPDVEVEVTGRLGGPSGMYQLQIFYEGRLYWVGSWNIRITGYEGRLLDTSYLYAYGRLTNALKQDINNVSGVLNAIETIWLRLQSGERVMCKTPTYARRQATDSDVSAEPIFVPLIAALDAGIAHTNAAVSAFDDACRRAEFYLTETDVNAALAEIDTARRSLNMARSLLVSLQVRDPLLGTK